MRYLVLLVALLACGGDDPVKPPVYQASMIVTVDSTVDSVEVRAADSLIVAKANETSRCIRWQLSSPIQSIQLDVWDAGQYIGVARWDWRVDRYPHLHGYAWYDEILYWGNFVYTETACS